MRSKKLLWLGAAMSMAPWLFGSGFGVYELGVTGSGSAGAYVSRAETGSALFYNPAGLVRLTHSELAISASLGISKSYYSNAGQSTWDSEPTSSAQPTLFFNGRYGRFAYGIGYATTFDYEISWEDADFPGRFLGSSSEFRVHEIMAGAGVKLTENLNLGATLRFAQLDYAHSRVLPRPLDETNPALFYEVDEEFKSDGQDIGFIVGLQYYRSRRFNFGLVYQSPIDISLDGRHSFSLLTRTTDPRALQAFGDLFAAGNLSGKFELPERISAGFSTKVTVRTRIEADVSIEGWSSVDNTLYATTALGDTPGQVVIPRDWDDTLSVRVSGDFQQRRALLWRMGVATSEGAVPGTTVEPSFPDYDRFTYSFGLSYFRPKTIFEIGLVYVQGRDRPVFGQELVFINQPPDYSISTGQEGLYETQRTVLNIGLRYRFGALKARN